MTRKILVIDDERSTRTNIISVLEAEGYEAFGAENGRVGIALAQQNLPDLIICDILMPGLDGYDVLTTLQQDPRTATIPFIFLTISASEAGYRQSIEMGADDYLSKPVTSEQLRSAIALRLDPRISTSRRSPVEADRTSGSGENPAENPVELQPLLEAKDRLLNRLCQRIPRQLTQASTILQGLRELPSDRDSPEERLRQHHLQELQEAIASIQAMVNESTVLQASLTPENAELLIRQFTLWENLQD
jgi:two-component system, OmpR family, alkaline phosphatase synthesis response regulator PhoP